MKIATLLLTHNNPRITLDTLDSIHTWVGNKTLVLVDEIGWPKFQNIKNIKIEPGFLHNYKKSPYRNCVLGLKKLYEYYPDSDWFLYTEYDTLFVSNTFQEDLEKSNNAWVVGFDLRKFKFDLPVLQDILNQGPIQNNYYFLGCCQFFHRNFISKLYDLQFFENFIERTKDYTKGFFPDYKRYAFEEELWSTLAAHLGGKLYEMFCWKIGRDWQLNQEDSNMTYAGIEHQDYRGRFKKYQIRSSPELRLENILPESSIIHPVKEHNSIRMHQEEKRNKIKKMII